MITSSTKFIHTQETVAIDLNCSIPPHYQIHPDSYRRIKRKYFPTPSSNGSAGIQRSLSGIGQRSVRFMFESHYASGICKSLQ